LEDLPKNSSIHLIFTAASERLHAAESVNHPLYRLYKTCRNDITEKILAKKLHSDAAEYVKKYEKTFEDVFKKAMEFNFNAINSSTSNKLKGVGPLIADYISNCILNPATIIENTNLNLAFYYEHRERQYGLS
jgi:hypothetical protein